jgi:hypothetical protein
MADDTQESARFSLRRWSQRKLAASRGDDLPRADAGVNEARTPEAAAVVSSPVTATSPPANGLTVEPRTAPGASRRVDPSPPARVGETDGMPALAVPLPPLESLTIDSDFSPFMQPGVDEAVKRSALRKLLRHPQFNVMDGLDVYIDDYSIPSPLEPALVRTMMQSRYIFNPPKTRVTAEGIVEDVPDEPASADADATDVDANALQAADTLDACSGGDVTSGSELQVSRVDTRSSDPAVTSRDTCGSDPDVATVPDAREPLIVAGPPDATQSPSE